MPVSVQCCPRRFTGYACFASLSHTPAACVCDKPGAAAGRPTRTPSGDCGSCVAPFNLACIPHLPLFVCLCSFPGSIGLRDQRRTWLYRIMPSVTHGGCWNPPLLCCNAKASHLSSSDLEESVSRVAYVCFCKFFILSFPVFTLKNPVGAFDQAYGHCAWTVQCS
jgi:hypothetical protein